MEKKKDHPVTIAGETYLLRYNFDALTTVEDLMGKPFFGVVADLQSASLTAVRAVFWAGLRKNHPDIKLSEIGELMDDVDDLKAFLKTITDAVNVFFTSKGVDEKNAAAGPKKAKAPSPSGSVN